MATNVSKSQGLVSTVVMRTADWKKTAVSTGEQFESKTQMRSSDIINQHYPYTLLNVR